MEDLHRDARLLAIDDSSLIHRLLRARLKHERIEIISATTGEDGLRLAREVDPDVILLGVAMPGGMNGFDVLRALKSDPETHDLPVIFLSAQSDTAQKVQGFELGAVDFIIKPFDIAELKARVRSAIRIRRLIQMLAHQAHIDGLTGLGNRSYFDEQLAHWLSDAKRHGYPVSLVLCDIDHFKSINDQHGHPFGDHVLEQFALLLGRNRGNDRACRYGGEEFALILPHTAATDALHVAERVRETLAEMEWEGHEALHVTASFGVADTALAGHDPAAVIAAADQALYGAKQSGRNRTCAAEPSPAQRQSA